jgi:hypothetical protein
MVVVMVPGGCSCGYNDEDDDNEDWTSWGENYHHFSVIPFCASSGYKPPRNGQVVFSI